jgi:hypothetical protein
VSTRVDGVRGRRGRHGVGAPGERECALVEHDMSRGEDPASDHVKATVALVIGRVS